jgi:hypothetical protein
MYSAGALAHWSCDLVIVPPPLSIDDAIKATALAAADVVVSPGVK